MTGTQLLNKAQKQYINNTDDTYNHLTNFTLLSSTREEQ
jgi:hypothetical protein